MLAALAAALDGSGPAILPLDPDLPDAALTRTLEAFAPTAIQTMTGTAPYRGPVSRARVLGGLSEDVPPTVRS